VPASALHAAEALARGLPLADERLATALAEPAAALMQLDLPRTTLWRHLVPLSATIDNNRQLAEVTLARVLGRGAPAEALIDPLARAVGLAEQAVLRWSPDLPQQLELRSRPLREQWEARGPGMLHAIGRWTDPALLVAQADLLVVPPALGGGGAAHLLYNSVRIEAVLAHPHPELPETVRLAWLLSQLNSDLPRYGERIHADRLAWVSALALTPPALCAAQEVQLAVNTPMLLKKALATWQVEGRSAADLADRVSDWWDVYQATRPTWQVALTALDQLLVED